MKQQSLLKKIYNLKNMKKYSLLILLLVFSLSFGQNNKKLDRIKAIRVAFISNKLDLTSDEAQKFWPIFNQFESKQFDLRLEKKVLINKLKPENTTNISDKEMYKLLDESENLENEIQNNRKSFVKNLQGIISPQKILLLKQVEEDFKKELLKQIRNNRNNRN